MNLKKIYICSECGGESPKWAGQCPGCGEWNTLAESTAAPKKTKSGSSFGRQAAGSASKPLNANELAANPPARLVSGITELDRVLGGGVVPGSFVLLGGEPGIGKSTLTLQLAATFAQQIGPVLLVSGEESAEQVALRAQRTGLAHENLRLLSEVDLETILATAAAEKPALLVVDSVQVMSSSELSSMPGSVPQIRTVAEGLLRYAKTTGTPVILIGHVTKEGELAGPQVLTHLVDVVLQLSGDAHRDLRILKTAKNRFGATSEVGVFEMTETGLAEVANPSAAFLEGRADKPIGSCITATVEGTRPLLVEVQALTSTTSFGYPKRAASGFELNRLNLLIAVLTRHAGLKLDNQDVFINVVGGFKLGEPAADLAVCLAIASSYLKKPLPAELVAFGEVGLSGEIRAVSQSAARVKEAQKLGFKKVASKAELKSVAEAMKKLF
jgi:DNA repair protein RadA/Sms